MPADLIGTSRSPYYYIISCCAFLEQYAFQKVGTSTAKTNRELREHLVGTNQLYMSLAGVRSGRKIGESIKRKKDARRHATK